MSQFEYQLLDKDKKLEIIDKQLLELEVQRFSLEMSEPNRLQSDAQQYTQWQSTMMQFEQAIEKLRKAKFKTENG
jgi:protein subunit release factor B